MIVTLVDLVGLAIVAATLGRCFYVFYTYSYMIAIEGQSKKNEIHSYLTFYPTTWARACTSTKFATMHFVLPRVCPVLMSYILQSCVLRIMMMLCCSQCTTFRRQIVLSKFLFGTMRVKSNALYDAE